MDDLVEAALQGTARRGGGPIAVVPPFDRLVASLEDVTTEEKLLLAAGALAVYRQAGRRSGPAPHLPLPAPAEEQPECSPAGARLVERLLSEARADAALPELRLGRGIVNPERSAHGDLLPEALELLRRAGWRLPCRLLPVALGVSSAAVRPALLPTLGARGRWLAGFNPAWTWAAEAGSAARDLATLQTTWREGGREARIAALRRARAADPGEARRWVAEDWHAEKADFRADIVAALGDALTADDEPFLEAGLDDRGATVRQEAARLLAALPGAALGARMQERADRLLDAVRPTDAGPFHLVVKPPATFDRAWERDGIDAKPPAGVGGRAWLLAQTLAAVPPAHWERRFGAAPDAIIDAAAGNEWEAALLWGWTAAARAHRVVAWAGPLLDRWWTAKLGTPWPPPAGFQAGLHGELVRLLPAREGERRAEELLANWDGGALDNLLTLLLHLPRPWSERFGRAYLHRLRMQAERVAVDTRQADAERLPAIEVAAVALPPACFAVALRPLPLPEAAAGPAPRWRRQLESFAEIVDFRRQLWEGLT